MSLAELKEQAEALTTGERLDLMIFLNSLNGDLRAELNRRMREMDEGKKIPQEEVERIHEELCAKEAAGNE